MDLQLEKCVESAMNNVSQLRFHNDIETQLELAEELEDCFISPEKLFTPRFPVLLDYFIEHGDEKVKEVCLEYKKILNS